MPLNAMVPKSKRFTRSTFPNKKPLARHAFVWGGVSLYESIKPHAAVVISKKTLKKAHERNRARRRVYEAVAAAGIFDRGEAMVVFLRREALTAPFTTIVADLSSVHR